MFYIDRIDKIKPLILLLIFVLFVSTILPLSYFSPLNKTTNTFNNASSAGIISFDLNINTISYTITLNSLRSNLFNNLTKGLQVIISVNTIIQSNMIFNIPGKQSDFLPKEFCSNFTLYNPLSFSSYYNIQTDLFLVDKNVSSVTTGVSQSTNQLNSIFSTIGRLNLSLYEKWLFVTLLASILAWTGTLVLLQKKKKLPIDKLVYEFLHRSYGQYDSFFEELDENSYTLLLFLPIIALSAILLQIYFNFFASSSYYSITLYSLKLNVLILIYFYVIITLLTPVFFNFIYDRFGNSNPVKKSKLKDNFIFTPVFFFLFILELIVEKLFSNLTFNILLILLAILINITVYFRSFNHHQSKYNYTINNWKNLVYACIAKALNLIVLFFLLQYAAFGNSSVPSCFLLF